MREIKLDDVSPRTGNQWMLEKQGYMFDHFNENQWDTEYETTQDDNDSLMRIKWKSEEKLTSGHYRKNWLNALGNKTPLLEPSKDMNKSSYAGLTPMKYRLANFDDSIKTPISTMKDHFDDKSRFDWEKIPYLKK